MSRQKAAPPTSHTAPKRRAVSSSGERNRNATSLDLTMQAVAVYSGQQCFGHVLSRGKQGFEAYDRNDKLIGMFPNMKAAADAVSLSSKT
jgi:septal ring-binding cell division protein DamX